MNVQPKVLKGNQVRLEPLSIAHVEGLARFADPSMFKFFGGVVLQGSDQAAVEKYVRERLLLANTVAFVTMVLPA